MSAENRGCLFSDERDIPGSEVSLNLNGYCESSKFLNDNHDQWHNMLVVYELYLYCI